MPIDFLTIKEFCSFYHTYDCLKMFKIAYFGLQFIESFQRRVLRPAPLAVIVAIEREIVLPVLKSLIMLTPLGNEMKYQYVWLVTFN